MRLLLNRGELRSEKAFPIERAEEDRDSWSSRLLERRRQRWVVDEQIALFFGAVARL